MKNKVIIFDFDGVILNSLQVTYDFFKSAVPFMTYGMFTTTYKNSFILRVLRISKALFSTKEDRKGFKKTYTANKRETELYDGMKDLVEELSQDYYLALNTNSYPEDSIPILEKHDLKKFFSSVKCGSPASSKQSRNKEIATESNIDLSNGVFITDTVADVEAAETSGMKAIAVTWGIHKRADFESSSVSSNIVAIVDTPLELRKAIQDYLS